MPKKVLVVEDEPLERRALVEMLKSYPLVLEIDEAANTIDFEEKVRLWKPDVVLLDIKIPGGNTLTSLGTLRNEGFQGKVVIVTAYDFFEYAQQAVGLNVTAFLVKPVKDDVLYDALNKAIEEIQETDKISQQLIRLKKFILENKSFVASMMIQGLVRGEEITEGLKAVAKEVGFLPIQGMHVFGVIALSGFDAEEKQWSQLMLLGELQRILGDSVFLVPWVRYITLLFFNGPMENPESVASKIFDVALQNDMHCNVVYMGKVTGLNEIDEVLPSLEEILEESILEGFGKLIYGQPQAKVDSKSTSDSHADFDLAFSTILEGMRGGQLQLVNDGAGKLFALLSQSDVAVNVEIVRLLFAGYIGQICKLLLDLKCDEETLKAWARRQVRDMMIPIRSVVDLKNMFFISLEEAWRVRQSVRDPDLALIQKALAFIEDNLQEANLSKVAEHVYVSPSYLSRMFGKVLNKRFIDVIKEKRIERAKKLLAMGCSVTETATSVGYDNITYFSTLFKEIVGCPPSEYKRSLHSSDSVGAI